MLFQFWTLHFLDSDVTFVYLNHIYDAVIKQIIHKINKGAGLGEIQIVFLVNHIYQ